MIRIEVLSSRLPDSIKKEEIREDEFYHVESELFKKFSNSVYCLWTVANTDVNEFLINSVLTAMRKLDIKFEESFLVDYILPLNGTGLTPSFPNSGLSARVYTKVYRLEIPITKFMSKEAYFGVYWNEAGCFSNGGTIDDENKKLFKNSNVVNLFPDNLLELDNELKIEIEKILQ